MAYAKEFMWYLETYIRPSDNVELVCHNTYFDGLVLFHHYQYVPTVYRDTLSMARALLIHAPSHSLDSLAKLLQLGGKLPDILLQTSGMRTLPADIARQLGEYAINDVDLTEALYERLYPEFPTTNSLSLTLRCGGAADQPSEWTYPVYLEPTEKLCVHVEISSTGRVLHSKYSVAQPKFTRHLKDLGVEIPYKPNAKGERIPALGKNDLGFREMVADYPEHKALFDGRLAAKSTINHTRIKRVYKIGSSGTLPMPLKYYGAHTGRWSGADGLNPQNFTRGSELRKSIIAPPGYVILVADLAQIEARLNMWFCGEAEWLRIFAEGRDIYTATAAVHFDVSLTKTSTHGAAVLWQDPGAWPGVQHGLEKVPRAVSAEGNLPLRGRSLPSCQQLPGTAPRT